LVVYKRVGFLRLEEFLLSRYINIESHEYTQDLDGNSPLHSNKQNRHTTMTGHTLLKLGAIGAGVKVLADKISE